MQRKFEFIEDYDLITHFEDIIKIFENRNPGLKYSITFNCSNGYQKIIKSFEQRKDYKVQIYNSKFKQFEGIYKDYKELCEKKNELLSDDKENYINVNLNTSNITDINGNIIGNVTFI